MAAAVLELVEVSEGPRTHNESITSSAIVPIT